MAPSTLMSISNFPKPRFAIETLARQDFARTRMPSRKPSRPSCMPSRVFHTTRNPLDNARSRYQKRKSCASVKSAPITSQDFRQCSRLHIELSANEEKLLGLRRGCTSKKESQDGRTERKAAHGRARGWQRSAAEPLAVQLRSAMHPLHCSQPSQRPRASSSQRGGTHRYDPPRNTDDAEKELLGTQG